jgi:hypothetical protein
VPLVLETLVRSVRSVCHHQHRLTKSHADDGQKAEAEDTSPREAAATKVHKRAHVLLASSPRGDGADEQPRRHRAPQDALVGAEGEDEDDDEDGAHAQNREDRKAAIINVASLKMREGRHGDKVSALLLAEDGKHLISADQGGVVLLWRLIDGEQVILS